MATDVTALVPVTVLTGFLGAGNDPAQPYFDDGAWQTSGSHRQ